MWRKGRGLKLQNLSVQTLCMTLKTKEARLKFSQASVTVISLMAKYQEAKVKLTNTKLDKFATKNKKQY